MEYILIIYVSSPVFEDPKQICLCIKRLEFKKHIQRKELNLFVFLRVYNQ